MRPIRLLRSATFRLALLYALIFGGSVALVLGFMYWSTAAYMSRQADLTIEAEIEGLAERYRVSGLNGLTDLIRDRLSRRPAGASIYLLAASDLTPLLGNLGGWPRVEPDARGWLVFRLTEAAGQEDPEVHGARARSFRLRGGYQLLVGRDMHELESTQRLIRRATFWALAIAALLALIGGAVTSRSSLRRIGAINATVAEIMAGDLSRRIPPDGAGDDFSQLVDNLNRMLERIEALLEGVKQVSDNIAHDLRTPLARLRNRLDELRQDREGEESRREAVEAAIREADGLLGTFGALLRIARLEAGSRRGEFARVDLASLAGDVVELYEPLAEERKQRLTARSDARPVVLGDRDLLFQALANLVDNALKHTPAERTIEVRVETIGARPRVTVSDDGPGIPDGEKGPVFRRFYRLDSSRTSPGSGLGLSLVGAVAKLHHVQIELQDNHPGLRAVLIWPHVEEDYDGVDLKLGFCVTLKPMLGSPLGPGRIRSMKARSSLVLVALAVVLAPAAGAQDIGLEDRWTIAIQGGLDSEITGDVLSELKGSLFARDVEIFRRTWRQTYEPAFRRGAVLIGFGVTERTEIVARGSVYEMKSPGVLAGSVEGSDLFVQLEPYKEYQVDLAYRIYLAWRTRMKSYIAPAAGLKFLDRILIESAFSPDRNSAIFNVPLYSASTVFAFGADIGFTIDLGSTFYVGLEAQIRYQTSLSAAETFPGLRGIGDGGDRLSAPVTLSAGVRF